ncbi:hypothetical protein RIF29_00161 [Crotalaria pallida]|uniref:Uncharacterized protein n=1 Tax=Crotalaria pallida TaxID=3830 RepID=A0AAN9IVE9_CROPI
MKLRIHGCPQLGLPKLFPTLKELFIANCPKLLASHSKWDLHTLPSLTQLTIKDEDGKYVDCKGWLSLPPNLEILNWKRLVVYDRQPFRYLR